jgi:S1-C subfamily serine protease
MKKATRIFGATGFAAMFAMGSTSIAGSLPQTEKTSVAPIVRAVTPGVVNITTAKKTSGLNGPMRQDPMDAPMRDPRIGPPMQGPMYGPRGPMEPHAFGAPGRQMRGDMQLGGSGVIVDAVKGYVLTNDHVVRGVDDIDVTTKDNRHFKGRVIGRDPATDIALLRIDPDNLVAVPMGDSSSLQVGDFVLAIGNPFGLGQTVTSGIVSALGRTGLGIEGYEDFIQTDASINPGSSGGALVTLDGKLVGLNTALLSRTGGNVGIGFAVPIDMVRVIMDQLIANGEVKRGRIGVAFGDPRKMAPGAAAEAPGALIESVDPASPAFHAGLTKGDIVIAANGSEIKGASALRNMLGILPVGTEIDIRYRRGAEILKTTVRIEPIKQKPARLKQAQNLG